ncbi:N-6 DNA methylase [Lactococcus lactis]|uniref:N-6 DNA methylase n=1 Tax=Lactococcus lactis TaxID=1358 RepID=UPI00117BD9CB|nr:N-6 DNA methylase [Lactococcus lactis]TRW68969.1 N-6 DNA methylase [Lactococcus lactis]
MEKETKINNSPAQFIRHFMTATPLEILNFITFNSHHFEEPSIRTIIESYPQRPFQTKNQDSVNVSNKDLLEQMAGVAHLPSSTFQASPDDMIAVGQKAMVSFLSPYFSSLQQFTAPEKEIATKLALYNLYAHYGLYEAHSALKIDLEDDLMREFINIPNRERIFHVLNLANSFTRGFDQQLLKRQKALAAKAQKVTALDISRQLSEEQIERVEQESLKIYQESGLDLPNRDYFEVLYQVKQDLLHDVQLSASARVNTLEDFRFTFVGAVNEILVAHYSENQALYGALLEKDAAKSWLADLFLQDIFREFSEVKESPNKQETFPDREASQSDAETEAIPNTAGLSDSTETEQEDLRESKSEVAFQEKEIVSLPTVEPQSEPPITPKQRVSSSEMYHREMIAAYKKLYDSYMHQQDLKAQGHNVSGAYDTYDIETTQGAVQFYYTYLGRALGTNDDRRVIFGVSTEQGDFQTDSMSTPIRSRVFAVFEQGLTSLHLDQVLDKVEHSDETELQELHDAFIQDWTAYRQAVTNFEAWESDHSEAELTDYQGFDSLQIAKGKAQYYEEVLSDFIYRDHPEGEREVELFPASRELTRTQKEAVEALVAAVYPHFDFSTLHENFEHWKVEVQSSLDSVQALFEQLKTDDVAYLFYVSNAATLAPQEQYHEKSPIEKLFLNHVSELRSLTDEKLKAVWQAEKDKTFNAYYDLWQEVRKNIRPALAWAGYRELLISTLQVNQMLEGTRFAKEDLSRQRQYAAERNFLFQFLPDKAKSAEAESVESEKPSEKALEVLHEETLRQEITQQNSQRKFRIYEFFEEASRATDRVKFLKNEYGLSGHSGFGDRPYFVNYDGKGVEFEQFNSQEHSDRFQLTWAQFNATLAKLIKEEVFLTSSEKLEYQEWFALRHTLDKPVPIKNSGEKEKTVFRLREVLEQVKTALLPGEEFVILEEGENLTLVKSSFEGLLNEVVIEVESEHFEVSDLADQITGIAHFKEQFEVLLDQFQTVNPKDLPEENTGEGQAEYYIATPLPDLWVQLNSSYATLEVRFFNAEHERLGQTFLNGTLALDDSERETALERYSHSSEALFEVLDLENLRTFIQNSRGGSLSEFVLDRTTIHSWQDLYDQLVTSQQVSIENNPGFLLTDTQEQPKSEISLFDFMDGSKAEEKETGLQGVSASENHTLLPQQNAFENLRTAYLSELADLRDLRERQVGRTLYLTHKERVNYYEYVANELAQQDNQVQRKDDVFEWLNEDDKQTIRKMVEAAYHEFGALALTFGGWQESFEQANHHEQETLSETTVLDEKTETQPTKAPPLLDYHFPETGLVYPKSIREKIEANLAAIRLVKALETEHRMATLDEQTVLAKYVGWGNGEIVNNLFDEENPRYEDYREALKQLLSEEEYKAARASSLTAFYTSPEIIQAIYQGLSDLGFEKGRILEPSMGTGNFFHGMPESMKSGSDLFGVEIDPLTASIAKQLQQTVNIQTKGFEDTHFAENAMDLVVTNAPFSDRIHLTHPSYDRPYVIHDYFIKRALDLVHAGGLVAVITSTGTMDKRDSRFRTELSQKARLLKAIRLPDRAFAQIAGTETPSDILIFQKDSRLVDSEAIPEWIETTSKTDDRGNQIFYNCYFEAHPEQVLGDLTIKTFNGGRLAVKAAYPDEAFPEKLKAAFAFEEEARYVKSDTPAPLYEIEEASDLDLPEEVVSEIEPYTLMVYHRKPYYHNGEAITLFQKSSSVTLNIHETRKNQLTRYAKNKAQIYDETPNFRFKQLKVDMIEGGIYSDDGAFEALGLSDAERATLVQEGTVNQGETQYELGQTNEKWFLTQKVKESTTYTYHVNYSAKEVQAMSAMIELRKTLQALLAIQHEEDYDVAAYEELRQSLNTQYDSFVKKYGHVSSRANSLLMRQDDYYQLLASIEVDVEDEKTKCLMKVKGTVFFEPTIQSQPKKIEVKTAEDALLASLNHKGRLDFDYMAAVYSQSKADIIKELGDKLFYVGEGRYATREDYLSGDVKTKLAEAKTKQGFGVEDHDWSANIVALEAVIPKDITISELNYKFGTRFIPVALYAAFLEAALGQKPDGVTIEYDKLTDSYAVHVANQGTDANEHQYGVGRYDGEQLAQSLLNQRPLEIKKLDPNTPPQAKPKYIVDEVATAELQAKGEQFEAAFKEWVLKNPDMQEEIVSIYNEKMNRVVPKKYDGSHLTIQGLAKQFTLRPHQKNAMMRIIQEQRAGLFHEVGSGKTLTMLAANLKLKELGVIQKPLFVIPKPLIDQFGREIYRYFPESKVLIAHSEDFSKDNRKRFISRIATGNYDFIVVADSQFGKIGMSKAYQERYIEDEIDKAERQMHLAKLSGQRHTVKKVEQYRKSCQERLEKLQKRDIDTFIDFEELGIDMLNVDEAQGYKNLAPETQLGQVKGISDARSQKAMDMDQKTQYLHAKYDNKRVLFSTGTPISNSVVELYTMMKYLAPDVLQQYDVWSFDSWVSTFGIIEDVFELNVAGNYKTKRRFTKFGNMPELRNMFLEVADIQTSEDLDLPVPKAKTVVHESHTTPEQVKYIEGLVARAEAIEARLVKPYEDNMLKILGENKKLTMDMRMLDSHLYTEEDSEKITQVVDSVFEIWAATKEERSTQMIFSDTGVPLKYRNSASYNLDRSVNSFSAYDEIKRLLVLRGVPEEEIRFIHEATDATKEQMMRDMRTGKIRILMASTSKGGTGLNVQDKLLAVHHLDVPWKPSDSTQRNGRIIRQGNENDEVQIHIYITKGSMDSFMWQTQENKKRVVDQLMRGKSNVREIDEMDNEFGPSVYKAIATDDPVKAEYMQLEMQVENLEQARNRYYESKVSESKRVEREQAKLPVLEERVVLVKQDVEALAQSKDTPFEMTLFYEGKEKRFGSDDKKAAAELFHQLITQHVTETPQQIKLAVFRGFEIYHISHGLTPEGQLFESENEQFLFRGQTDYHVQLSLTSMLGTLVKINNKLDKLFWDLDKTTQEIERIKAAIERLEAERSLPFPREEEFKMKTERLKELKGQLDHKENETVEPEHFLALNGIDKMVTGEIQGIHLEELDYFESSFLEKFDLTALSDEEMSALTFNLVRQYQDGLKSLDEVLSPADRDDLALDFHEEEEAYAQLCEAWTARGIAFPNHLQSSKPEKLSLIQTQLYAHLQDQTDLPREPTQELPSEKQLSLG